MELKSLYADSPKFSVLFNTEIPILRQLFVSFDDTIFAWTPKGLVAGVQTRLDSTKTEATCNNFSSLFLTCRPFTPVLHLELNRTGSRLALMCANSCYVVQIPLLFWNVKSCKEKFESEYLCSCLKLDSVLHETDYRKFLRVRWHPGSATDKHLVTLCTDNVIRIYNVDSGDSPIQSVILSNVDSFAVLSPRAQNLRFSIGESAVSFDFGPPVKLPLISKDDYYPIFVLYGNGDVYSVLTDVNHSRQFSVNGPLTISPPAEDNYGVDSCDLILLTSGKGPHAVTVLVVATTYGNLYHCVVFLNDSDTLSNEQIGASFSLHVYENVELEFSLSTVDLVTKELREDTYESSIRLYKDKIFQQRYFCTHETGLHSVYLKWMHDLERINGQLAISESDQFVGFDSPAIVDYYICTCPQKKDAKPAPIVGLANVVGRSLETFLIVLLSDFTLQSVLLRRSALELNADSINSPLDRPGSENGAKKSTQDKQFFIDHVKNMLQRTSTMPLLKAQNKNLSELETAELLLRSIDVFKNEYLKKLEMCHRLCVEMCEQLNAVRKKQETDLIALTKKVDRIHQQQNLIHKRLETYNSRQNSFSLKLDFVRSSMSEKIGPVSEAEEEMIREMRQLDNRAQFISEKLNRLNAASKSYEMSKQNAKQRSNVDETSLKFLQSRLEEQSRQIEILTNVTKKLISQSSN